MNSMTGYGRAKVELPVHLVSIEISSVNKRNLEVVFAGPKEWQTFEQHAIQLLRKHLDRGRIRISLNLEQKSKTANESPFDEKYLELDLDTIRSYMEKRGQKFALTPDLIVQVANLRKKELGIPSYDEAFPFLETALLHALKEMKEMRVAEGIILSQDLKNRTEILAKLSEKMKSECFGMAQDSKDKLLERLRKSDLELDQDDDRVLKEIALYAEKCDVSEEITRLDSHLEQISATVGSKSSVGRKIEFLLQEVSRELNTLCSKSTRTSCTNLALEARAEVEKMREQAMNVE